jgi:hypothetical protein
MDSFSSTTAAVAVGGVGGNVGVGGVATTVTPLLPPPSSHNTSPRIIPATSTSVSSSTFPTTNTSNNSINTSITTSSQVSMEEQKKKLEKKFMENRPQLAFAKLVGKLVDNVPFECLITQLPAELGRGPITSTSVGGRVCLGEQKAISRQHAKITWNAEKNEYELTCLGKNGMFAAGKLVSKDQTIELKSKMPLKIGGARIYFLKALKSPCSNLSGFKMLYKLYHQKHLASGSSVTCEEIIQQILEMFPKSEQDLGGKQNLTEFIT